MGYISTDARRSQYKLSFGRRLLLPYRMRREMSAMASASYVELASREWDFGLGKPVRFASHSEGARVHADQLPTAMIAASLDGRDVVVLLYEGADVWVAGVLGASFQVAGALYRFLTFNWLSLEWVADGSVGEAPGHLRELYADPLDCIAGVDLVDAVAVVHSNRAYGADQDRPRALVDLIQARAGGRIADLELEAMNARLARLVPSSEPMALAA